MAAPRLLSKTDLTPYEPATLSGRAVLEGHGRLAALLAARGLPTALFAEPVLTRRSDGTPSAVSWYGEGDGEPTPLGSLSPARRADAEAALRSALASLTPALDDAESGPMLRRALLVADPDSVLFVDGRVTITGWGLVPRGTGEDPVRLATLLREGLGRYHPGLADAGPEVFAGTAPIAAAASLATAGMAAAATTAAPVPPRAAAPPPPLPPAAPAAAAATAGGWWMLPAGLGVAIVFLLLGFWLGWRAAVGEWAGRELIASVVEEGPTRAAIARNREASAELERQIAAARAALAGEICRPEGPLPSLTPVAPPGEAPSPAPTEGSAPAPAPDPAGTAPAGPIRPEAPRDEGVAPPPAPDPPPLPAQR